MSRTRPATALRVHDPLLGPVLRAHATKPRRLVALAVTCRALDAGIPPSTTYLWLRSRGGEAFASATFTRRFYQPILSAARRKVTANSSPAAREKVALAAARRLVGCLLAPVPVRPKGMSPARVAAARHAFAIIGLDMLDSIAEKGWDTVLVNNRRLAVQMGVGRGAAASAVNAAIALGWLSEVTDRRGQGRRVRLPRLTPARGQVADQFTFAVDALAVGQPRLDPVAEVIAVAAHPAVGHGLGRNAWLRGLALEADLDATGLDAPKWRSKEALAAWVEAAGQGDLSEADQSLSETLVGFAIATGAQQRFDDAEALRRAQAAQRAAETAAHRDAKTKAHKAADRLAERHPVPTPTASAEAKNLWVSALSDTVAASNVPEAVRPLLAKAIAGKMRHLGHSPGSAQRAAAHIVGMTEIGGAA